MPNAVVSNLKARIGNDVVFVRSLTDDDITKLSAALTTVNGLADVATSGTAADVAIVDADDNFTATNVEAALAELANNISASDIHLADESVGQSDYAKVYKLYKGSSVDNTQNTLIGAINIPKDKVVQGGSLVDITFSNGTLLDGATDVTALINSTPTATDAGKYIKLVLQNVTDPLYISVKGLVDVYTGSTNAETTTAVTGGAIEVTVNDIAATKITYVAADTTNGTARESVGAALTRIDTALSDLGITNVVINSVATADNSLADGTLEFSPAANNF